jgi:hypothetical protein
MNYKDRTTLILAGIGVIILLIGIVAAFYGPIEMYCFYLFSEGGRFHYEGFGFGSFMFGNIATQIIGYYVIAVVAIPLGYGHLKVRRWVRPLAVTLLWSWLVVGLPLVIIGLLILITAKKLPLIAILVIMILLALAYFVIPGLLIRFYQSRSVRAFFEARKPTVHPIETFPIPILVLCTLYIFYIVVLHIPIFFNGAFPFFGTFFFGLDGIFLLDVSILCLVLLTWCTLQRRRWAWWGALIYFLLMTLSLILTLVRSSYADILSGMNFPPTEMEMLGGVPAQGIHFAVLIGIPLLATLGAIVLSRRYFIRNDQPSNSQDIWGDKP